MVEQEPPAPQPFDDDQEQSVDQLENMANASNSAIFPEQAEEDEEDQDAKIDEELNKVKSTTDWSRFPSIDEYRTKWEAGRFFHARVVPGDFSNENLIPAPDVHRMQDVPWVPFDKLRSDVAQAIILALSKES